MNIAGPWGRSRVQIPVPDFFLLKQLKKPITTIKY